MRCPKCQSAATRVVDSRPAESQTSIRRRRECEACGSRFTTFERAVALVMVEKRSGRIEAFAPEKLRLGVEAALADRPVAESAVEALLEAVESEVRRHPVPMTSSTLGHLVLEGLRSLDEVAYLRFASVYKDFQGLGDFEREMAALDSFITRRD